MKKYLSKLFFAILFVATTSLCAQAPNSFNYQAVLRNAGGDLITGQLAEMRFTVRNSSANGTIQYRETQNVTPNEFGLVNHAIGTGNVVSGTFAGITWATGTKFLQVELNTGSGFVNLGAEKLNSVPFAVESSHAQTAESATSAQSATTATNATNSVNANNATNATNAVNAQRLEGNGMTIDGAAANRINYSNSGIGSGDAFMLADVWGTPNEFDWIRFVRGSTGIRFRVTQGGRVGVGSAAYSDVQLDVTSTLAYGLYVDNSSASQYALYVNGSAAKPGGGSWVNASDQRLKENIEPYADGLSKLLSINPVTYHYNSRSGFNTSKKHVGVIAQELQEIAPYMVGESKVNRTSDEEFLNVDNSAMTYMLINAVKEQQAQIEALKAEIEILKNK